MSMTRKELELRVEELLESERQLIERASELTDLAHRLYAYWCDARGEISDHLDYPRGTSEDERELANDAHTLLGVEAEDYSWEDEGEGAATRQRDRPAQMGGPHRRVRLDHLMDLPGWVGGASG
jgi:hypothetical protein